MSLLPDNRLRIAPLHLLLILALLTSCGPFAVQIFLPALPAIAVWYEISPSYAQLSFSLSLVAIAIGMPVGGSFCDTYGRRTTTLWGLIAFIVGGLICIFSWDINQLIVGRFIQAMGGSVGLVASRAISRDLYSGDNNARLGSYVLICMIVAPGLAPIFGSYLVENANFGVIFIPSILLGMVAWLATFLFLPETQNGEQIQQTQTQNSKLGWLGLLKSKRLIALLLIIGTSTSTFYALISSLIHLIDENSIGYGIEAGPYTYATLLGIMTVGFVLGNAVSGKIVIRFGIYRVMGVGLAMVFFVTLAMGLVLFGTDTKLWALLLLSSLFAFGNGLILANCVAAALDLFPQIAGKVSALVGFGQMGISALIVQILVTQLHYGLAAVAFTMILCTTLALCAFPFAARAL